MKKSKFLLLSTLTLVLTSCSDFNSTPIGNVVDYRFAYDPTSEPHINQQLHTLSPLGDIYSVWNYYRGDGVKVAVIDTEFRTTHEEFYDYNGKHRITEDSAHIYKTGAQVNIDVGINKAGKIDEGDWHGTMCAGLLGASVNGKGTTGIAPNCDLMLLKVDRSPEAIAKAFMYAADKGAKVISISLGQYASSSGQSYGDIRFPAGFDLTKAFQTSINYAYNKGVTIVSAVGNDKSTTLTYPAGCDNVIGAGGLAKYSSTNMWSDSYEGSNYNGSKTYVDVFAPSAGIYTPGAQSDSGYMNGPEAKGTSFAAPIIAGAAALYFQKYKNATNVDFERDLRASCTDISSYNQNKNTGWGALNISKLLNISEDIKPLEANPSGTDDCAFSKLQIVNKNNASFSTFHIWGLKFNKGYGYRDFERYLTLQYGERILTSDFNVKTTTSGWAYTDEHFVGDYYIKSPNLDFLFWYDVIDFSFQVLDGNQWLPENGGYTLSNLRKNTNNVTITINAYSNYVSYSVLNESATVQWPTIKVSCYDKNKKVGESIALMGTTFDSVAGIDINKMFYDSNKTFKFGSGVFYKDTVLYV